MIILIYHINNIYNKVFYNLYKLSMKNEEEINIISIFFFFY